MSKKKGLGRDINTSVEVMDELLKCLSSFHTMPLKRGLKSNKVYDDDMAKVVNDVKNKAYALHTLVEDLRNDVVGVKPKTDTSKRFASQRVISKFLSMEDEPAIKVAAEAGKYEKLLIHTGPHIQKMHKLLEQWGSAESQLQEAKRKWEQSDLPKKLDLIEEYSKELDLKADFPKELQKFIDADFSGPGELLQVITKLEDWAEEEISDLKFEADKKDIEL